MDWHLGKVSHDLTQSSPFSATTVWEPFTGPLLVKRKGQEASSPGSTLPRKQENSDDLVKVLAEPWAAALCSDGGACRYEAVLAGALRSEPSGEKGLAGPGCVLSHASW